MKDTAANERKVDSGELAAEAGKRRASRCDKNVELKPPLEKETGERIFDGDDGDDNKTGGCMPG